MFRVFIYPPAPCNMTSQINKLYSWRQLWYAFYLGFYILYVLISKDANILYRAQTVTHATVLLLWLLFLALNSNMARVLQLPARDAVSVGIIVFSIISGVVDISTSFNILSKRSISMSPTDVNNTTSYAIIMVFSVLCLSVVSIIFGIHAFLFLNQEKNYFGRRTSSISAIRNCRLLFSILILLGGDSLLSGDEILEEGICALERGWLRFHIGNDFLWLILSLLFDRYSWREVTAWIDRSVEQYFPEAVQKLIPTAALIPPTLLLYSNFIAQGVSLLGATWTSCNNSANDVLFYLSQLAFFSSIYDNIGLDKESTPHSSGGSIFKFLFSAGKEKYENNCAYEPSVVIRVGGDIRLAPKIRKRTFKLVF